MYKISEACNDSANIMLKNNLERIFRYCDINQVCWISMLSMTYERVHFLLAYGKKLAASVNPLAFTLRILL